MSGSCPCPVRQVWTEPSLHLIARGQQASSSGRSKLGRSWRYPIARPDGDLRAALLWHLELQLEADGDRRKGALATLATLKNSQSSALCTRPRIKLSSGPFMARRTGQPCSFQRQGLRHVCLAHNTVFLYSLCPAPQRTNPCAATTSDCTAKPSLTGRRTGCFLAGRCSEQRPNDATCTQKELSQPHSSCLPHECHAPARGADMSR